jgi:hypothetical protein
MLPVADAPILQPTSINDGRHRRDTPVGTERSACGTSLY